MSELQFIDSDLYTDASRKADAFRLGQQQAQQAIAKQQQDMDFSKQSNPLRLRSMTAEASTAETGAKYAAPEAQSRLRQMDASTQSTLASTQSTHAQNRLKVYDLLDRGMVPEAHEFSRSLGEPPIPPQIVQNGQMRAALKSIDESGLKLYPSNPAAQKDYHDRKIQQLGPKIQGGQQLSPFDLSESPEGAPAPTASSAKTTWGKVGTDNNGNATYGWIDPQSHTVTPVQGPQASGPEPGTPRLHGEDYLNTLPPAEADLIRGIAENNINPNSLSTKGGHRERILGQVTQFDPSFDQTHYTAKAAGAGAGARTEATREKNLDLILRAADAAIPAALEQSDRVVRYAGSLVPVNKIIQHGQVMTSDPELKAFGMANLQLAEHWARAMNPTGVMRESDRDKALDFLSTADSASTYKRLVLQLRTQIQRERDSISGGSQGGGASTQAGGATGGADHSKLSDDDLKRRLGL